MSTSSCSSDSYVAAVTDSKTCTDGFLCDTNNSGADDVDINYEVSKTTVNPGSGAKNANGSPITLTLRDELTIS